MEGYDFEKYFKPGDKVRCTKPGGGITSSSIGEVIATDAPGFLCGLAVRFDRDIRGTHSWPEDSLELVKDE